MWADGNIQACIQVAIALGVIMTGIACSIIAWNLKNLQIVIPTPAVAPPPPPSPLPTSYQYDDEYYPTHDVNPPYLHYFNNSTATSNLGY